MDSHVKRTPQPCSSWKKDYDKAIFGRRSRVCGGRGVWRCLSFRDPAPDYWLAEQRTWCTPILYRHKRQQDYFSMAVHAGCCSQTISNRAPVLRAWWPSHVYHQTLTDSGFINDLDGIIPFDIVEHVLKLNGFPAKNDGYRLENQLIIETLVSRASCDFASPETPDTDRTWASNNER